MTEHLSTIQKAYISLQKTILIVVGIAALCYLIDAYDEYYVLLEDPIESGSSKEQAYVIHSRYWGWKKYAYSLRFHNNQWHMLYGGQWEPLSYGSYSTRDPIFGSGMFIQNDSGNIKYMK